MKSDASCQLFFFPPIHLIQNLIISEYQICTATVRTGTIFGNTKQNNTKTMQLWIISLARASVLQGCFLLEIYSLTILLQFLIPKITKGEHFL